MDQPITSVTSVCPYCGVGCGLVLHVESGRVTKVTGNKTHPANFGRLCTKGLTGAQAITAPGRLTKAYLRPTRNAEQRPVPMATAIAQAATRLRGIIDTHGPDSVAFYVSGQMSLEAQYLINKLAKGFVKTNNIDSNSRLCMSSAASGYKLSLGADGPPGSYDDFDHADLFFVTGANMADCHPILFLRLLDRVKAGAKLIVVDPRRTATVEKADLFLQIKPGTDLALLNGLLHLLVADGHIDQDFIANFTEGWAEMPEFLAAYTPAHVAAVTGVSAQQLRQAAAWIGQAGHWMSCWTMGLNQSTHGTWHTNAVCNLHLATGAICRQGSGPFSLTGQPNAMGGREMGYLSQGLPGQRTVSNPADRAFMESLWRIPPGSISPAPGLDTVNMFTRMAEGEIKAAWIICTNPVASVPNRATVIAGLQAAELVITQDAFLDTETNAYADIMLPGALWAEADGVMVNSERNLTLAAQAVPPPGDAMADWQIIAAIARAMGYESGFAHTNAAEVFDEIRLCANPQTGYDIRGASHDRLARGPLQWPCAPSGEARNPIRYTNRIFPTPSGRARFFARPALPPAELPDDAYPFILNTGRLPHQWHTMTKTGKIPTLTKLNPGPFVELHPEDAAALGVAENDTVEIRSRRGKALLPATLTTRVQRGGCFAPFHWNDVFGEDLAINAVTNDAADPISAQPEFKFCAVALTRIAAARLAEPPVPAPITAAPGQQLATILFASQTGNAEALAGQLAAALHVPLHAMDDYPVAALPDTSTLIIISSTYGDGEAPDNGRDFWAALTRDDAPRLENIRYAVCALGDSSYDQFAQHGKNLDARLAALGATRLRARFDCDGGTETALASWLPAIAQTLGATAQPAVAPTGYTKNSPFPARLLASTRLNRGATEKDTRFIALSLEGSGLTYEVGDTLGVWPTNCPELVDEILLHTGLANDVLIRDGLLKDFEITKPSREFVAFIAERHADLTFLLADRDALKQFLWGKQLPDVLAAFPVKMSAEKLISVLKPMQPRSYSISSSPRAHGPEIHLTVSAVRFGARKGACSTFLADRGAGADIPVFIQPATHFRLPRDPDTPIIMIGPGTGIAPFRAFLDDRRATGARGRNWLFFGERNRASDFYYEDELLDMQADGFLTELSLAFSRDQAEKRYVQHCLAERGETIWSWLQDGAAIYVCGDASAMAKDVEAALLNIIQQHGGFEPDAAYEHLRTLAKEKRYLRDVY
jgi:NADPH-dependent sulfite reductase flavoprotein alpha-component